MGDLVPFIFVLGAPVGKSPSMVANFVLDVVVLSADASVLLLTVVAAVVTTSSIGDPVGLPVVAAGVVVPSELAAVLVLLAAVASVVVASLIGDLVGFGVGDCGEAVGLFVGVVASISSIRGVVVVTAVAVVDVVSLAFPPEIEQYDPVPP